MTKKHPIEVTHLFHTLDNKLLELLKSLTEEEWNTQTVAKRWKVKDVAAHLLDGNIRTLSIQRDKFFGEKPEGINSYTDLVNWLNQLNADWVKVSKRISPQVLIMLHELTGKATHNYYCLVDLDAPAIFPVSWAGEEESKNWFHIAREYTEKWLHQQQIRDAVNKPGILTPEFFTPFLETIMYALPYTYRDVEAKRGTCIQLTVTSSQNDSWFLKREENNWRLSTSSSEVINASITLEANAAWKLFSKSWRAEDAKPYIKISGDKPLAEKALEMVSFMA